LRLVEFSNSKNNNVLVNLFTKSRNNTVVSTTLLLWALNYAAASTTPPPKTGQNAEDMDYMTKRISRRFHVSWDLDKQDYRWDA
jgi:hypothetical protein